MGIQEQVAQLYQVSNSAQGDIGAVQKAHENIQSPKEARNQDKKGYQTWNTRSEY